MPVDRSTLTRRDAIKCLAYGRAGTVFALSGGLFTPIDLALAAGEGKAAGRVYKPLFVQISDTHIGFNREANPDVEGTLARSIDLVKGAAAVHVPAHHRDAHRKGGIRAFRQPSDHGLRDAAVAEFAHGAHRGAVGRGAQR